MYCHVVSTEFSVERPEAELGDVAMSPLFHRVSAACPVLHLLGYLYTPSAADPSLSLLENDTSTSSGTGSLLAGPLPTGTALSNSTRSTDLAQGTSFLAEAEGMRGEANERRGERGGDEEGEDGVVSPHQRMPVAQPAPSPSSPLQRTTDDAEARLTSQQRVRHTPRVLHPRPLPPLHSPAPAQPTQSEARGRKGRPVLSFEEADHTRQTTSVKPETQTSTSAAATAVSAARWTGRTGSTSYQSTHPSGQLRRVCVHVHGVYGYFLVPQYDPAVSAVQFGAQLEAVALRHLTASASSSSRAADDTRDKPTTYTSATVAAGQLLHDVELVERYPFYGFHVGSYRFFKVSVIDPHVMPRLMELLSSTTEVGGRRWQIYDGHISYPFQFMVDYNIRGIAPFLLPQCRLRSPSVPEFHRCTGNGDKKEEAHTQFLAHFGIVHVYREDELPRVSVAEVEVDVAADHLRLDAESTPKPGENLAHTRRLIKQYFSDHGVPDALRVADTIATEERVQAAHQRGEALLADPADIRYGSVTQLQRNDPTAQAMRQTMQRYLAARSANGAGGGDGDRARGEPHKPSHEALHGGKGEGQEEVKGSTAALPHGAKAKPQDSAGAALVMGSSYLGPPVRDGGGDETGDDEVSGLYKERDFIKDEVNGTKNEPWHGKLEEGGETDKPTQEETPPQTFELLDALGGGQLGASAAALPLVGSNESVADFLRRTSSKLTQRSPHEESAITVPKGEPAHGTQPASQDSVEPAMTLSSIHSSHSVAAAAAAAAASMPSSHTASPHRSTSTLLDVLIHTPSTQELAPATDADDAIVADDTLSAEAQADCSLEQTHRRVVFLDEEAVEETVRPGDETKHIAVRREHGENTEEEKEEEEEEVEAEDAPLLSLSDSWRPNTQEEQHAEDSGDTNSNSVRFRVGDAVAFVGFDEPTDDCAANRKASLVAPTYSTSVGASSPSSSSSPLVVLLLCAARVVAIDQHRVRLRWLQPLCESHLAGEEKRLVRREAWQGAAPPIIVSTAGRLGSGPTRSQRSTVHAVLPCGELLLSCAEDENSTSVLTTPMHAISEDTQRELTVVACPLHVHVSVPGYRREVASATAAASDGFPLGEVLEGSPAARFLSDSLRLLITKDETPSSQQSLCTAVALCRYEYDGPRRLLMPLREEVQADLQRSTSTLQGHLAHPSHTRTQPVTILDEEDSSDSSEQFLRAAAVDGKNERDAHSEEDGTAYAVPFTTQRGSFVALPEELTANGARDNTRAEDDGETQADSLGRNTVWLPRSNTRLLTVMAKQRSRSSLHAVPSLTLPALHDDTEESQLLLSDDESGASSEDGEVSEDGHSRSTGTGSRSSSLSATDEVEREDSEEKHGEASTAADVADAERKTFPLLHSRSFAERQRRSHGAARSLPPVRVGNENAVWAMRLPLVRTAGAPFSSTPPTTRPYRQQGWPLVTRLGSSTTTAATATTAMNTGVVPVIQVDDGVVPLQRRPSLPSSLVRASRREAAAVLLSDSVSSPVSITVTDTTTTTIVTEPPPLVSSSAAGVAAGVGGGGARAASVLSLSSNSSVEWVDQRHGRFLHALCHDPSQLPLARQTTCGVAEDGVARGFRLQLVSTSTTFPFGHIKHDEGGGAQKANVNVANDGTLPADGLLHVSAVQWPLTSTTHVVPASTSPVLPPVAAQQKGSKDGAAGASSASGYPSSRAAHATSITAAAFSDEKTEKAPATTATATVNVTPHRSLLLRHGSAGRSLQFSMCPLRVLYVEVLIRRRPGVQQVVGDELLAVGLGQTTSASTAPIAVRLFCVRSPSPPRASRPAEQGATDVESDTAAHPADTTATAPRHFPTSCLGGKVLTENLPSERALLCRVRDEILAYDPDIILSWEGFKYGIGFLALRYHMVWQRSLARDLSRLGRRASRGDLPQATEECGTNEATSLPAPASTPPEAVAVPFKAEEAGVNGKSSEGPDMRAGEPPLSVLTDALPTAPSQHPYSLASSSGLSAVGAAVEEDAEGGVGSPPGLQHRGELRAIAMAESAANLFAKGVRPAGLTDQALDPAAVAKQYAKRFGANVRITGRVCTSLGKSLRKQIALPSYTLSMVYHALLGRTLPFFSDVCLAEMYQSSARADGDGPGLRHTALSYLLTRVVASYEVARKLNFFTKTAEFSRLYGVLFEEVLTRGSQYRVEATLLRMARPMGFTMLSPSVAQVFAQPRIQCIPLILQPRCNLYRDDPIIVLDFRSLYPSVIVAYNLCYTTCLGLVQRTQVGRLGVLEDYHTNDDVLSEVIADDGQRGDSAVISPNGAIFVRRSTREGVLPAMVRAVLDTRFEVQSALKRVATPQGDADMQAVLHEQQLALKMLSNVTYGYTAASFTGRMPCVDLADAIVSLGRQTLERAIAQVHETTRWRAEVVYGDTDSLFIRLPGRTRQEAFAVGEEMAKAVTASNPAPIRLQFEKVIHPCLLLVKKRYVGYAWSKPEQTSPTFLAKGIETVRRDQCPVTASVSNRLLRMLFDGATTDQLREAYYAEVSRLYSGECNPASCIFRRAVKLGRYRNEAHFSLAARLALRLMEQDLAFTPFWGERLPYVVVCAPDSDKLRDCVTHPQRLMLLHDTLAIEARYYIQNHVNAALDRMLYLIGVSATRWFREMPRKQRRAMDQPYLDLRTFLNQQVRRQPRVVTMHTDKEGGRGEKRGHSPVPATGRRIGAVDPAAAAVLTAPSCQKRSRYEDLIAPAETNAVLTIDSEEEVVEAHHTPILVDNEEQDEVNDENGEEENGTTRRQKARGSRGGVYDVRRVRASGPQPPARAAHKTTLDAFYPRTRCVVCEVHLVSLEEQQLAVARLLHMVAQSSGAGTVNMEDIVQRCQRMPPICVECWRDPAELYTRVRQRGRAVSLRLRRAEQACLLCMGGGGLVGGPQWLLKSWEDPGGSSAPLCGACVMPEIEDDPPAHVSVPLCLARAVDVVDDRVPREWSEQSIARLPHTTMGCTSIDCALPFEKKRLTLEQGLLQTVQWYIELVLSVIAA